MNPSEDDDPRPIMAMAVLGPTASGKSHLAMKLAQALGGELVNCDSVQLFRGFDIGSAKPTPAERQAVPHHLIDVLSCGDPYDAALYARDAAQAIAEISARGRLAIVVGGTGLYFRALLGQDFHAALPKDPLLRDRLGQLKTEELSEALRQVDPERLAAIHPNDRFRLIRALEIVTLTGNSVQSAWAAPSPPKRFFVVRLAPPRAELRQSIATRTDAMLAAGWIEEVKGLITLGWTRDAMPMRSIGYREIQDFLAGTTARDDLKPLITQATCQYAKRQSTWFRKVEADVVLEVPDLITVAKTWERAIAGRIDP